jgi:hypothetical protein
MLTSSKLKRGEGSLEEYNPILVRDMHSNDKQWNLKGKKTLLNLKGCFEKAFFDMKDMVEELYR